MPARNGSRSQQFFDWVVLLIVMKRKKVRQLAAVMFTDIVGYTAMMQDDEARADKIRQRHREAFQQEHQRFNGEIIQYYGDGTLSIFKSAVEAVQCAIEIQQTLQMGNVVPLRIGLHVGDIVMSDSDVFGDGVNVASRIENLGVAGSILLSSKVSDELKNHQGISAKSLGFFELKNINSPIEVFAITNQDIIVPGPGELKGKPISKQKTIAVLPFVNMSKSEENEYFSDGITEEIINALAKIKNLKVTSRTSSFFFKNKKVPIHQIGKELNVSAILEGSVRRSRNTLRITAQLIQAEEDFHFWSETWDRKSENIFEIQDEISLLIAEKMREHFGHFEIQPHLVDKQTENLDAYEYYLKARFYFNKWNVEDVRTAIALYEKALELDPNHAESILGLADCYGFLATTGFMPYKETWGKVASLTNRARLLNDQKSGVHYQLGNLAFFAEANFRKSFIEASKAVEINPNHVEAQHFISFLHILAGNKEKAFQYLETALSIDPLSQETLFFRAYYYYMAEDFERSLQLLNRCIEHNPKNIPAHSIKGFCLLKMGRYKEVLNYFDQNHHDFELQGDKTGLEALAHTLNGDAEKATLLMQQIMEEAKQAEGFRANAFLFLLYACNEMNDQAFEWIQEASKNNAFFLLMYFNDPMLDSIKNDPRHKAFQKTLFPETLFREPIKKKKILLNEDEALAYANSLLKLMENDKPYLNSDLSLRTLADQIGIHPNQLSWLLNESLGKNFNEFINHYRVEAFKQLATDPKNANISIVGLAYDSGFNSKTVFNTYFKKETGITPKQFLRQQV